MKNSGNKKKKKDLPLIIGLILLFVGVALLLVDPIKNHYRKNKVEEGLFVIESQIENSNEDTEMTFVVPVNGNEVDGEEYDYFTDDSLEIERQRAELQSELESLGDEVTLRGLGILEIKKIDLQVPLWDEASLISLRYGVGHYETSVLPGENGNCAILGHHMRAYGSMFNRLGEVEIGDVVSIRTVGENTYNYEIDRIITVSPEELDTYLEGNICEDARITLVTCTYTSSGTQRLLVMGHLIYD